MGEPENSSFEVSDADWESDSADMTYVREVVFIREQGVSREEEMDGLDGECLHVVAHDESGQAIGTARLDSHGHIGRVAVLKEWRGKGVGNELMDAIVVRARKQGWKQVELNSQTHAAEFYQKLGFVAEGDEFEEAGIPHIKMVRVLE